MPSLSLWRLSSRCGQATCILLAHGFPHTAALLNTDNISMSNSKRTISSLLDTSRERTCYCVPELPWSHISCFTYTSFGHLVNHRSTTYLASDTPQLTITSPTRRSLLVMMTCAFFAGDRHSRGLDAHRYRSARERFPFGSVRSASRHRVYVPGHLAHQLSRRVTQRRTG